MYHPFYSKDFDRKFESNTIFQIGASNTEICYTETQLQQKQKQKQKQKKQPTWKVKLSY